MMPLIKDSSGDINIFYFPPPKNYEVYGFIECI